MTRRSRLVFAFLLAGLTVSSVEAASLRAIDPLFPVSPVIATRDAHELYPSVAGDYLVYSQRKNGVYSVVRVNKLNPGQRGRVIARTQLNEMIRFGVALRDGSIGYVSNRMGPISAWMRQAHGDGHVAIANQATYRGALSPMHLAASPDGRLWAFDTTLQKIRRNTLLDEFGDGASHVELLGQSWRMYNTAFFRHKLGYKATRPGTRNDFAPPSLFVFDRNTSQLTMIPNAFDGAISPDGRRIAFVRETNGNYDLWMQDVDGGDLVQLTDTPFGEFEPAWSPDGRHIAFVSNRDSRGNVLNTSIYIMDIMTGRVMRLTNAPSATDGGPAWKDAHTVLFHSNRSLTRPQSRTGGGWNIWQVTFE